jgi:hypothetical protein
MSAAVQEHLRMQNLSTTGAGRFTLYNDGASSYATFTNTEQPMLETMGLPLYIQMPIY